MRGEFSWIFVDKNRSGLTKSVLRLENVAFKIFVVVDICDDEQFYLSVSFL